MDPQTMEEIENLQHQLRELNIKLGYKLTKSQLQTENYVLRGNWDFEGAVTFRTPAAASYIEPSLSNQNFVDFGQNWTKADTSLAEATLDLNWSAISISTDGKYQLATVYDGYLYVSSNYGSTWQQLMSVGSSFFTSCVVFGDGRCQMATDTTASIYVSDDYGYNWNILSNKTQSSSESYITGTRNTQIIATNSGFLYRSTDQCQTVSVVSNGLPETASNWISVAGSADDSHFIAAIENGAIYLSRNGGVDWEITNSSVKPWYNLAISETGQYQTAVTSEVRGIFLSLNYGESWQESRYDFEGTLSAKIVKSIAVSASGQFQYLVTQDGVFYLSENYGQNWFRDPDRIFTTEHPLVCVAISYSNSATEPQYISVIGTDGTLLATNNFRTVWDINNEFYLTQEQTNQISPIAWTAAAISHSGEFQLISGSNSFYTSNDSGVTWIQNVSLGFGTFANFTSADISSNGQYQTACASGLIISSQDYGKTWQSFKSTQFISGLLGNGERWSCIRMTRNGQYRAVCSRDGNFMTSNNYGQTWNLGPVVSQNSYYSIAIHNDSPNLLFLCGINNNQIFVVKSDNGNQGPLVPINVTATGIPVSINVISELNLCCFLTRTQFFTGLIDEDLTQDTGLPTPTGENYYSSLSIGYVSGGRYFLVTEYGGKIWFYAGDEWTNVLTPESDNDNWITGAMSYDVQYKIAAIGNLTTGQYTNLYTSQMGSVFNASVNLLTGSRITSLLFKNAISSSGQYQLACCPLYSGNTGLVYISTNYGLTWSPTKLTPQMYFCLGLSVDGRIQVAGSFLISQDSGQGELFISRDAGLNWNSTTLTDRYWKSVALSANGKLIMALTLEGHLYKSSDYGVTWSQISTGIMLNEQNIVPIFGISLCWDIVISANGQYQTIAVLGGLLYTSNDYGETWNSSAQFQSFWFKIAMSSSGQYQSALGLFGLTNISFVLFTSSDFGVTWIPVLNINYIDNTVYNVTMSANGQYQAILGYGLVYNSSDYGLTWQKSIPPALSQPNFCLSLCSSSSGDLLTAIDLTGFTYYCRNYSGYSPFSNYRISPVISDGNVLISNLIIDQFEIYQLNTSLNHQSITITLPQISLMFPTKTRQLIFQDVGGAAGIYAVYINSSGTDQIILQSEEPTISNQIRLNKNLGQITLISNGSGLWLNLA